MSNGSNKFVPLSEATETFVNSRYDELNCDIAARCDDNSLLDELFVRRALIRDDAIVIVI